MIKKAAVDALNPDGESSGYTTGDAEYVITEDKLKTLCSKHNSSNNSTAPTRPTAPTTGTDSTTGTGGSTRP